MNVLQRHIWRMLQMNKVIALFLSVVLALSLMACNQKVADEEIVPSQSASEEPIAIGGSQPDRSVPERDEADSSKPSETQESETQVEETQDSEAQTEETQESEEQTEEAQESEEQTEETQDEQDLQPSRPESDFYATALDDSIKARITGISYPGGSMQISYDDLVYVHVLYKDFNNQTQQGELICNKKIGDALVDIFSKLYAANYQIDKIRLIDEYGGDDDASCADDNTSCFNYRPVTGGKKLSKHAYGLAIDINPFYNPYVTFKNGQPSVLLDATIPYIDRSADFSHKIDENDLCYKLFTQHGFKWGGAWNSVKDYQHFEIDL